MNKKLNNSNKVHRLRVKCVSGPWLDTECVRFIDIPEHANLYDLHIAIQDSVNFDDEYPFYFFKAVSAEASQCAIPPDLDADDEENIDDDVYEGIEALCEIDREHGKRHMFYAFKSDFDDWIFQIDHTGEITDAKINEFYPLTIDALSVGPNPEQYGSGFDDYSTDGDDFCPHDLNMRRNPAEYNPDDEQDDGFFGDGCESDSDDFFEEEDEEF